MPESESDREHESEQYRKLFIGGLHYETNEDDLKKYYEQWGEVVDCVVMRDPHTRMSRGFGFITYKKSHMVDDAQRERPHKIDKKEVESKRAMPREDAGRPEAHLTIKKVYVSGIKEEIDEMDLQEYFSQFGNVEEVEIITDKETKKKRGFAFVTYDDYDPVDKVVLLRHHMIKNYRCDAKKALSKEEMNNVRGGRGGRGGDSRGGRRGGGGRDRYDDFGGRDRNGRGSGRDNYRDDYRSGSDYRGNDRWGGGGGSFGSGYGGSSGGGPVRGGDNYNSRGSGPYGGGYGSSGGNYGGSSYGGGNSGYGMGGGGTGGYGGGDSGSYGNMGYGSSGGGGGFGGGSGGYGGGSGGYGGGASGYGGGSGGGNYSGNTGGYGGGSYGGGSSGGTGYGGGGGGYGGRR